MESTKMRQHIKKLFQSHNLEDFARQHDHRFMLLLRQLKNADQKISQDYFSQSGLKKLHIGCGENILKDWLNSDYYPLHDSIFYLDATHKFPFADNTFDYVFSEHMIEHVPFSQGNFMLSECYRVLKPNGVIRISTPDLQFLMKLYQAEKTSLHHEYIHYAIANHVNYAPYDDAIFVINNFVRNWGHTFIYDEKTLTASLTAAKFTHIHTCEIRQSKHETLQDLELEERMPEGYVELESLILEGVKM